MNRLLLTLTALIVIFASCNKADEQASVEDDLRSGTWRITSERITYKDPVTYGDSTQLYQPFLLPCVVDNTLEFKANYTGILNFGSDHCSSTEPGTKEFTWGVTENDTHLAIYNAGEYFPTNTVEGTILTRTLGYLTIRYRVVMPHPDTHTYDTVYFTDVMRKS
jgi:hypothetical protein